MIGHFIHGHGPEHVLVLHGWLGDWRVFEPMLPALDEARLSLAFLDYRGYGRSKHLDGPFDLATIAADALALADALNWETFHLIGHSMGGKAALRVAANDPHRARRLLAITPVWAGQVPFDTETLAVFRGAAKEVRLREAIIANTGGGRQSAAWARNLAARSCEVSSCEAFGSYFESWAFDDFASELRQLETVTKVLVGSHDAGISREWVASTWLQYLSHASLEILPEAGHYPMLQTPVALASVVEAFLLSEAAEAP
jgi:pimeloyl-ACP methyl ester carboxylesterase